MEDPIAKDQLAGHVRVIAQNGLYYGKGVYFYNLDVME
jgi:hypothetical protein